MVIDEIIPTNKLAVYVGNSYIRILLGNRNKIYICESLKTPENSVMDEKIVDIDAIYHVINKFIREKKIKTKFVSFAIDGQDIVIRNIEVPIMEESNIRSAIEWEVNQYLPEDGINHYLDYQLLDKIVDGDKKVYKILTAAVPKEKIDVLFRLSERLDLKIDSIDISANCIARGFKNIIKLDKSIENIGIIDVGNKTTSIIILEKGKLFMEREVHFGINNAVREVIRKLELDNDEAYNYVLKNIDFSGITDDELDVRIKTLFDNVFSSFIKVIQFYSTGKVSKNLDKIYITGFGPKINGLSKYISDYFQVNVDTPDSTKKLNLKCKLPNNCDLAFYINVFGLLLRKE